jgi:hypothetical protein
MRKTVQKRPFRNARLRALIKCLNSRKFSPMKAVDGIADQLRSASRGQPVIEGKQRQFQAVGGSQLVENVGEMALYCVL